MIDPKILKIKPDKLRLINVDNRQLGIFSLAEAEKIAEEKGLDLILVNAQQKPIVVKLGNYGAYVYEKEKKERKSRKEKETKEIRISFREAIYDLKRKAEIVKEFLTEGHQVQIKLILKGRERNFQDLAEEKLNNFLNLITDLTNYKITQPLKKTSNFLLVILGPK
ncbi:MAG: translation initiation factor IF-3 [Candidatus Parcubacteria bacterium]|nr:MAG: translation initiation factor IF-3 [Candidatus Parcubacteria bacterium]